MRTLSQTFTQFFDLVPKEELVGTQEYLRGLTVRWTRAMAVLMVVSVVPLWPTDAIIFRDSPSYQHALWIWRAALSSTCFVLAVGLTYWDVIRLHPVRAFIIAAAIVMGASGYAVGQLGGINNPFFYAVYPIPATTVALLTAPRARIVANLTIVLAYLTGFIAALHPERIPVEFAGPVIFLLASSTGMTFLGHIVYRLVGSNFTRQRRLEQLVDMQKRDLALATREALTAHDKVRERVLRDLHDNVGPVITALHLETFAARQGLQRNPAGKNDTGQYLDTIESHTKVLKKLIRGTLSDLDPYGIERGLLTDVIGNTLAELGIPDSYTLHCSLDGAINDLPMDLKQALHLIVRECANNTVKHSEAARIELEAGIADGMLHFRFRDDGMGCDLTSQEGAKDQYGLAGIRLRAIDAGGAADIVSAPGEGLSIQLRIPLRADAMAGQG